MKLYVLHNAIQLESLCERPVKRCRRLIVDVGEQELPMACGLTRLLSVLYSVFLGTGVKVFEEDVSHMIVLALDRLLYYGLARLQSRDTLRHRAQTISLVAGAERHDDKENKFRRFFSLGGKKMTTEVVRLVGSSGVSHDYKKSDLRQCKRCPNLFPPNGKYYWVREYHCECCSFFLVSHSIHGGEATTRKCVKKRRCVSTAPKN